MSRSLCGVLALLLTAGCSSCASSPSPRDRYVSHAAYVSHESSVRILVICLSGQGVIGSGTAITDDTIITAGHVAQACDGRGGIGTITVTTLDGTDHAMLVSQVSSSADVATLIALDEKAPFHVYAHLASAMPAIGSQVCWVGGDGNLEVRGVTKCGVYEGRNEGYDAWLVSGKGAPGNSGSGVFNAAGELVGVLSTGAWNPGYDFVIGIVPLKDITPLVPYLVECCE